MFSETSSLFRCQTIIFSFSFSRRYSHPGGFLTTQELLKKTLIISNWCLEHRLWTSSNHPSYPLIINESGGQKIKIVLTPMVWELPHSRKPPIVNNDTLPVNYHKYGKTSMIVPSWVNHQPKWATYHSKLLVYHRRKNSFFHIFHVSSKHD